MTLKSGLRVTECHWKWLPPFDRLHTSSYSSFIVTVAISCVVSEINRQFFISLLHLICKDHLESFWISFQNILTQTVRIPHSGASTMGHRGTCSPLLRMAGHGWGTVEERLITTMQWYANNSTEHCSTEIKFYLEIRTSVQEKAIARYWQWNCDPFFILISRTYCWWCRRPQLQLRDLLRVALRKDLLESHYRPDTVKQCTDPSLPPGQSRQFEYR